MSQFINIFLNCNEVGESKISPHENIRLEIEFMLNHTSGKLDLETDEDISSSVLNYGIPSYVGMQFNDDAVHILASKIKLALCRFEPRFDPRSIVVDAVRDSRSEIGMHQIHINARLNHNSRESWHGEDIQKISCKYNLDLYFGGLRAAS